MKKAQLDPAGQLDQKQVKLAERYVKHQKLKDANELYALFFFKEEIGQGAFGRVIEVTEKNTLKVWAMKIVTKAKLEKWSELQQEIKILKFVSHPHIIKLEAIFETSMKLYMLFELCSGTLQKYYEDKFPLSDKTVKIVVYDIVDAVAYLHKNNIVHRDIKMQNILLTINEKESDEVFVKLSDFGLSLVRTGRSYQDMIHQFCGTLYYMAPEICEEKGYSELCDIWSLGVITYMMLLGKKPFSGKTESEVINNIVNSEPTYSNESIVISEDAVHLLKGMLRKTPTDRFNAALILEHPWLSKKKQKSRLSEYNVLDMMKMWKDDIKIESSSRQTDWEQELSMTINLPSQTQLKSINRNSPG